MQTTILQGEEESLNKAVQWLKRGELVAFPTETVYGLGACLFNKEAISKIYQVKKRPQDNPLIAHIASLEEIERLAIDLKRECFLLAEAFFPGPLTLVLKKRREVPSIVSAGGETIAIRMPHHKVAQRLIQLVNEPLVAPSANLSGRPSSTKVEHVLEDFEGKIPAVIDGGECLIGIESTVLSLYTGEPLLLRPGAISKEVIEDVLRKKIGDGLPDNEAPLSPGMKYRHYAPHAKVILVESPCEVPLGQKAFSPTWGNLYSSLRAADQEKREAIYVLCDEKVRSNTPLMNRLHHASCKKM